jgi:hypothetical protein
VGVTARSKRGMERGAIAPLPLLVLALVAALILTVRIEEWRLAAQRRRTSDAMLAESNRSAERDTTRDVAKENARVAKLLGDSLKLVEKQVVQAAQKRDDLDAALGRERAAKGDATAVVDSLERVVAATDSVARDVRVAQFNVRQEPYSIVAEVEMPAPPDSAKLRVKVGVDPIPIEARVTCAETSAGVREAAVSVRTPAWVTVRIGTVSQSPGVCAEPQPQSGLARRLLSAVTFVPKRFVVGAGRAWATDGHARWAVFVGAGVTL